MYGLLRKISDMFDKVYILIQFIGLNLFDWSRRSLIWKPTELMTTAFNYQRGFTYEKSYLSVKIVGIAIFRLMGQDEVLLERPSGCRTTTAARSITS